MDCFIYKGEITKLNEDINAVIIQFMDKQTRFNYLECYYQRLLEETGDYKEYRQKMKEVITEYWNDRNFWGSCYGVEWTDELEEEMKIDIKRAIKKHCQRIYQEERVKCDICGCQLQRGRLSRRKKTQKCKSHNSEN